MKKQTGIWIDTSKAIIVTLSGHTHTVANVESDIENSVHHDTEGDKGSYMGSTHVSHEKTWEERKRNQTRDYLNDVAAAVSEADELYICGPAEMKTHLKKKIEGDHKLSSRLKAVETADSMTLNEVVAKVKRFFQEE